jgi:hypothetical protein
MMPETFTTTGSRLAYVFWCLTAHPNIGDVAVEGPWDRQKRDEEERPGDVDIFIALKGGKIPNKDDVEIRAVKTILGVEFEGEKYVHDKSQPNWEKIRTLTDKINVYPIKPVYVDYVVTWFITNEQAALIKEIEKNIEEAVAEYEQWQVARVGRDINPDKLIQLCRAAGAKRIVISRAKEVEEEEEVKEEEEEENLDMNGLEYMPLTSELLTKFKDNSARIQFGGVESE